MPLPSRHREGALPALITTSTFLAPNAFDKEGRDLERAQPAIELKLRIDLDALRGSFEIEADVDAWPDRTASKTVSGLNTLVGLDDHRNVKCEQTPRAALETAWMLIAFAAGCRMVEF